jgi:hypothetical protein
MLTQRLLSLLASCASALATSNIIQYPTHDDFNSQLQDNERLLVSFTSQSLDSVIAFNNIFIQSAENSSTPLVSINCDTESSLCAEHDINAYPTVRLFERSQEAEIRTTRYRGPRTPKALQSFVKKRELPILSHLQAPDSKFRRIDSIVIIAFLAPDDKALLDVFESVAQRHHSDFVFGYITDSAVAEKENVPVPSIICYRNDDNDNLMLSGSFSTADVDALLASAKTSFIKNFREKDLNTFMQRDKLTVYIFTSSPENTALRHELVSLAKTYQSYVTFGIVDTGRYAEMPANFGVKMDKDGTALVVHAPVNDNVFFYDQGKRIEKNAVEKMLTTILQGNANEGQIFGTDAEDMDIGTASGHDEL